MLSLPTECRAAQRAVWKGRGLAEVKGLTLTDQRNFCCRDFHCIGQDLRACAHIGHNLS